MKKLFLILMTALMATSLYAQDPIDLAKQRLKMTEAYKKLLKGKPTKDAKKQAKELKKAGWLVPAGERGIEYQIMESHLYEAELMLDENEMPVKRYIIQSGISTAGTYNAGYAAARANAQVELAAMLETELVAAMESKLDNAQANSRTAITVEEFHERMKSVIDMSLTNTIPVLRVYRPLSNNNFEVQVRVVFDKKELAARIKRNMQKELELEGDNELNGLVDERINSKF